MYLRILHRTRYIYRVPVTDGYNQVRLRPATEDPRRLSFYLLKVHPPCRLRHFRDDFFNYVQWFEMPEPHDELIIEAQSRIHTTSQYQEGGAPTGICFDAMAQVVKNDMLHPFLSSSHYVTVDHEIWHHAVDAREERKDVFETAEALMRYVYQNWNYESNSTAANTHMSEVLKQRRGVCQDFAHVMIGLCRSLNIPARYVSGYLYNGPNAHLRGAQASHAWCEIWLPERGWFGLDPTNNTRADDRYVKIATGRDYEDAAPVRGNFNGPSGATAALQVVVEVEKL